MFICLPIIFGVNDRIKPDSDKGLLQCPRCHNDSVIYAKSTRWFELFFVPLIPFSSKHICMCNICGWRSVDPPLGNRDAAFGVPLPPYTRGWTAPNHPGYQPAYIVPSYSPPPSKA